jgi:hypothetical protein
VQGACAGKLAEEDEDMQGMRGVSGHDASLRSAALWMTSGSNCSQALEIVECAGCRPDGSVGCSRIARTRSRRVRGTRRILVTRACCISLHCPLTIPPGTSSRSPEDTIPYL